jgi:hypothetical protein
MTLARKDVRAKLDADDHAAMKVFARLDGLTEAEFIEGIVHAELSRRIGDATVAAAELQRAGILGKPRDSSGKPK